MVLKQSPEKITFLAEFRYPLWLVPWSGMNLLFDGLSTSAHSLSHKTVPDLEAFKSNLERSSKALETYADFLSSNASYFRVRAGDRETVIGGLLTDQAVLSEFSLYIVEAAKSETAPDAVALSPTLDENVVTAATGELASLKSQFQGEIEALYANMKLLNKTTNSFVKAIRGKMKEVRDEYGKEIEKQEAIVQPKIRRLEEEYDEQVSKLARDFEKQLAPLQKEKAKLQKVREQAAGKVEHAQAEAKVSAARKDAVGERKWKEKANESKKDVSELDKKIKDVDEKMKKIEESRSAETFRLRSENEAKMTEAKKDLLELEAERDAKLQVHKVEIEKLQQLTSDIIGQIDTMAKTQEANVAGFAKLGMQQVYEKPALMLMPFYLACYQSDMKRRYVLFPPSVAGSVGLAAKLKGALGMAKIKQFLTSRFKAIDSFLNGLPSAIGRNAVFERELDEAGAAANLLNAERLNEQILAGLEQLNEEGWFSEKEYEAFKRLGESQR